MTTSVVQRTGSYPRFAELGWVSEIITATVDGVLSYLRVHDYPIPMSLSQRSRWCT